MEASLESGRVGQFDVIAGGETIASRGGNWFTRQFGAGYPDFDAVLSDLGRRIGGGAAD